ncbi:MAG: GMC family oxidoreductase [Pirellulaceae bacterium]
MVDGGGGHDNESWGVETDAKILINKTKIDYRQFLAHMQKFDSIIVGAGSAGCLLADRLAADRSRQVLVIEPSSAPANENDRRRPSHWLNLLGSSDDWDYSTEATSSLSGRSLRWPRGRGMGGSGRINAMIWFPPTQADIANLADCLGRDVGEVRDAFERAQSIVQPEPAKWHSSAAQRFLSTAKEFAGIPVSYQRVNRNGRRWTPAGLLDRPNIQVVRATADRVLFSGDRATGIRTAEGEEIQSAEHVYLCAGAIATPMILMRSGIGPIDVLSTCDIEVRINAPAVGANLQDHLIMPVVFGVKSEHAFGPIPSEADVQTWEATGDGPVASNIAEVGGLFDDDQIQIHVTPTHYLLYPNLKAPPAMTIGVNLTQPQSRGRLTITSADPHAPPRIEPNYLATEYDLQKTIEGVRLARQIAASDCFANIITGELLPGTKRESDESIAKSVQRFSQTLYHPVGTAAGIDTGCENLRIVDASVLKQITVGNPNAAVMTLAMLG